MTKSLEELLDLDPQEKLEPTEIEEVVEVTRDEIMYEAETAINAISVSEKVDHALSTVTGLSEHDNEMDDISRKALSTYENLLALGLNVPDVHAGKIYEVAGNMLKTAMDAREAKVNRKIKMIDLQLKKLRIDKMDGKDDSGTSSNNGVDFDRNDLMKHIIDVNNKDNDK